MCTSNYIYIYWTPVKGTNLSCRSRTRSRLQSPGRSPWNFPGSFGRFFGVAGRWILWIASSYWCLAGNNHPTNQGIVIIDGYIPLSLMITMNDSGM